MVVCVLRNVKEVAKKQKSWNIRVGS